MSSLPVKHNPANPSATTPEMDVFETRSSARFGIATVLLGICILAIWANFAPLSSAAIAPGVLVVESKRQQVEHLEGGIVRGIHISDGEFVDAGELLLEIESTASRSRLEQTRRKFISLLATRDRLSAELNNSPQIQWDERLLKLDGDNNATLDMQTQSDLFKIRRQNLSGQVAILEDRILQLEKEIDGHRSRLVADQERLKLAVIRLEGLESLNDRGFATSIQLSEVQAQEANLKGSIGDLEARIGAANLRIDEVEKELLQTHATYRQETMEDFQKTSTELGEFDASFAAAEDVVTRMQVLAPISGRIVGLNVTTEGSVIEGGERLMEIVPQNDRLVIDVLVKPEDIDSVFVGQKVDARLTAFNPRTTPPVPGQIINVSADRVVDERSGVAAYSATVAFNEDGLSALDESQELYPGMPAEVMIIMEDRTFAEYLLGPIISLFDRGLRES